MRFRFASPILLPTVATSHIWGRYTTCELRNVKMLFPEQDRRVTFWLTMNNALRLRFAPLRD